MHVVFIDIFTKRIGILRIKMNKINRKKGTRWNEQSKAATKTLHTLLPRSTKFIEFRNCHSTDRLIYEPNTDIYLTRKLSNETIFLRIEICISDIKLVIILIIVKKKRYKRKKDKTEIVCED